MASQSTDRGLTDNQQVSDSKIAISSAGPIDTSWNDFFVPRSIICSVIRTSSVSGDFNSPLEFHVNRPISYLLNSESRAEVTSRA